MAACCTTSESCFTAPAETAARTAGRAGRFSGRCGGRRKKFSAACSCTTPPSCAPRRRRRTIYPGSRALPTISPPRRTGGRPRRARPERSGGICRSQAFSRISTESTRIIPSRRIRRTARSACRSVTPRRSAPNRIRPPRKLCAGGWLSCRAKMRGSIRCSACWRAIRACFPQAPAPEKARIYRFTTI